MAALPITPLMELMTEAEAVHRAREGDVAAFEFLYREHASRVFALALRLTGRAQLADELAQDAFVRAWQRLTTFRGDSAFGTWLYRLTVNVALEGKRSEKRRLRRVEPRDPDLLTLYRARESDPSIRLDLDAAIQLLPARARTVYVLHDVEGYDYEEIARLTGRAVSSVRAQLSRARDRMRELLAR